MLGCPYAIQRDERDKILCQKTAGCCGHVYFCQLSSKWKQSRGAETCTMNKPAKPEPEPVRKAEDEKAVKRRKARKA